jgi:hypothetical protein
MLQIAGEDDQRPISPLGPGDHGPGMANSPGGFEIIKNTAAIRNSVAHGRDFAPGLGNRQMKSTIFYKNILTETGYMPQSRTRMATPKTTTLRIDKKSHATIKKHIKKFRKGMKLESWVEEALQEKMVKDFKRSKRNK